MIPREIRPTVYSVGAVDWERRLFDAIVPLPDGTSYNCYLVKGSNGTALIDTVDPSKEDVLIDNLNHLGIEDLDYVVANHAEQDHSGTLHRILERYPRARIVSTPKCKGMLLDLLTLPEGRITTVNDKETVSLGDRTLEFIYTPWVHWPETMCTYLKEERILFSCDFFGAHLGTSDLYVTDEGRAYEAAKRYYAEIMMPYRTNIQKDLEKLKDYSIDIIATSHGPIYDKPEFILKAYHSWVFDEPGNIVVLPYVSMHGSTRRMVEYLTDALVQRGVTVKQFDLTRTDIGKLAIALVDAATIVIGAPTMLASAHPNTVPAAFLANILRPKLKFASIIGSYGWGGRAVEQLTGLLSGLKLELLEPVICRGFPKGEDFEALDRLAEAIAQKHKESQFV
ncbi:MAG: FprA family A-type flavoprotein [Chloroflexi bacterium]|nr:FprA family A-type flavoprotein [Chloroflexota bacterium]